MDYTFKVGRDQIKVRETIADRLVAYFDPERGTRRLVARAQAAALAGGFTGGSKTKRTLSKWRPGDASADAALLPDLPEMRDRSSDLLRNEPLAAGAINTVCTSVVGTGLALRSVVDRETLGWTEKQADAWQRATQRRFHVWASSEFCDITLGQTFYGLQDLALRSTLEKGDTFVKLPFKERKGWPFRLAVQLIEAERVVNKNGVMDSTQLAGGVEMDANGAPVRYHILKQHPGAIMGARAREWDVVDAFGSRTGRRNVLHLFDRLRIGQTRGMPYLAPVIDHIKQIGRYTEAEISAAVISSFFAVFVKSEAAEGFSPNTSAVSGNVAASDAPAGAWNGELSSGLVADLRPGESIETANPGRPNTAFDPFVQAILRQIGVCLELPFEVLIKHFTASYSAARAALLDAWRFYMKKRSWLADKLCQPVYEAWLADQVALGHISAPGFFADAMLSAAYCGSQWVGDAPGSIDPLKEAMAAKENLAMGRTTLAKETLMYDGSDWRDNTEQQGREQVARKSAGLLAEPSQPPGVGGAVDDSADGSDKEADDTQGAKRNADAIAGLVAVLTAQAERQPANISFTLPETIKHELVERLEIAGVQGLADAVRATSTANTRQIAALASQIAAGFAQMQQSQHQLATQALEFEYDGAGNPVRVQPVAAD